MRASIKLGKELKKRLDVDSDRSSTKRSDGF